MYIYTCGQYLLFSDSLIIISVYCTLNWELGLFSQLTPTILGRCESLVTLLLLLLFSDVDPVTESCAGPVATLFSDLSVLPEIVIFLMDRETADGEATFWFRWSSAMCSWLHSMGATCLTMGETRQGPCTHTWD